MSDKDYLDLKGQINDAVVFLTLNKTHLELLSKNTAIAKITLDFAFNSRIDRINIEVQLDYFPPELIRLAGNFNMGIALTQWPCETTE